jgi:molybdopterin synthase catalytic subunit
MIHVKLNPEKIELSQVLADIDEPGHGAQLVFTGVVRNRNHGRNVLTVSYDAFAPLAQTTFREICEEAQAKWGKSLYLALVHRVGTLQIGDISVIVLVSSPHRDESYQASRYIIENLKTRAPIWKKETYDDGETEWLQGHALCGHQADL